MNPFLIALCFVLLQPAPIAPDAASYQARKQLFNALDVYAENPSPEQAAVCGQLIDQMISQLPKPALRYYLDGAKAAELVGRPDQAMTILQTTAAKLASEKWPGVNQTAAVGANMWLGRIARDSGQPQQAADSFMAAAAAVTGDYAPVVRSMNLAYAGEIYAGLGQPDKAAALFRRAGDFSDFKNEAGESLFYTEWANRNLQTLENNAADVVAPASDMLEPQMFLYPVMNGISLPDSGATGIYGNPRYKLLGPYLDGLSKHSKGQLDREITQFLRANEFSADKKWDSAEAILKGLFGSQAFLAPVAGFKLASFYQKQQKLEQAVDILEELAQRWPNSNWPRYADKLKSYISTPTTKAEKSVAQASALTRPQATLAPNEPQNSVPPGSSSIRPNPRQVDPPTSAAPPPAQATINPLNLVLIALLDYLRFSHAPLQLSFYA